MILARFITAGVAFICVAWLAACERKEFIVDDNVAVPMRDGVVLRATVYRPGSGGPFPVLVYRTPYDRLDTADAYQTHLRAIERGYAVVMQDVRGRYASEGIFDPYRNEGQDGYDTIEWAARQPWSNGDVGTFGLSYPGAAQWLAAVESPPHLRAMVPAMTYSSPSNFIYMNGVFDLSWLPWIYLNIAPDARVRLGLPGPASEAEAAAAWEREGDTVLSHLPLADLPILHDEAPFYFEWLEHGPTDPWWSWAGIRGRYARTDAAVLNISGWYDEAYGPEGAVTNHNGLVAARKGKAVRSELILGPWMHGVSATGQSRIGELDFGPESTIDYDDVVLDFFDTHLKRTTSQQLSESAVRYFVMGSNEWRQSSHWPPPEAEPWRVCLRGQGDAATLGDCSTARAEAASDFHADPADPVTDPHKVFGPHDYQALEEREDLLIFETDALTHAVTMVGSATATLFVSCDCPDFDLWVRLLDVYPDGRAINLMSPGTDVQRVSYRDGQKHPVLQPGEIVALRMNGLLTANQFKVGHRIRLQVSASFAPHLSRNLQTGLSEIESAASVPATIKVHHDTEYQSALVMPVIE